MLAVCLLPLFLAYPVVKVATAEGDDRSILVAAALAGVVVGAFASWPFLRRRAARIRATGVVPGRQRPPSGLAFGAVAAIGVVAGPYLLRVSAPVVGVLFFSLFAGWFAAAVYAVWDLD